MALGGVFNALGRILEALQGILQAFGGITADKLVGGVVALSQPVLTDHAAPSVPLYSIARTASLGEPNEPSRRHTRPGIRLDARSVTLCSFSVRGLLNHSDSNALRSMPARRSSWDCRPNHVV